MLRWTAHLKGPKRQHAAVAVGHQVYSFGGYCAWDTSDTHAYGRDRINVHIFNTVSLRWRTLSAPTATPTERGEPRPPQLDPLGDDDDVPSMRDGHTAVPIGDIIYIWGGFKYTRECCDVLYAFRADTHRWFRPGVSGTAPEARCGHSACVLDKIMYVYGGFNVASRHTYSDIYRLDTAVAAAAVWSPINAGGAPASVSECHSATVIGTKMFVFGGTADQIEINYDDVRVFDTETDCWLSGAATPPTTVRRPLPEGRACHSAFAHNGELYIFGGANFRWDWSFSEEMWRFSPEASSWKKVAPKENGPRSMSRMCCCVVGGRVVLFGGYRCVHTPAPVDVEDCEPVEDDDVGHREGEVNVQNLHHEDMDGDADDVEGLEDEGACDAEVSDLYILDLSPSLKTLCKLAVIQCGLEQSELPHDIRWELAAMATNGNRKPVQKTDEHCSEQLPGNLSGRKRKARGLLPIQKENIT